MATAQSRPNPISDLFKNPKKILWVKHYKGRVDDLNDVVLVLAYDGKLCKGYITYLRSKEDFRLEGTLEGQSLMLQELGDGDVVTGHFEGKIERELSGIQAHWYDKNRSKAGFVTLGLVSQEVEFPSHCGDNKWIRRYEGFAKGDPVRLLLQQNSPYDLRGVVYFQDKGRTLSLRGGMATPSSFKLALINDLDQTEGYLEGSINSKNLNVTGEWTDKQGDGHSLSLRKTHEILVGCVEYHDYQAQYDVLYPKSKNSGFNAFMDYTVEHWKNNCQQYVLQLKGRKPKPEKRGIARASGWYEMEHLSDRIISGHITFSKSWEDEVEDIPFNYDLSTGESITLESLFLPSAQYRYILREKVLRRLQFTPLYALPEYREWLEAVEFKHFTIREDGIRCGTSFHPIYGRQAVTIPFQEIRQHLRDTSPVAHLFEASQEEHHK